MALRQSTFRKYLGRLLCVVKMLKVGVFLGQGAEAGGMPQYAKKCVAVLDQNDDVDSACSVISELQFMESDDLSRIAMAGDPLLL